VNARGVARAIRRRMREAPLRVRASATAMAGVAAGPTVRVSYGFGRIPRDGAHGGMVKLQRLHARFPNQRWRFNVLYLVSSRLPPGAEALLPLIRSGRVALVWNQNGVAYPAWHGPGWEETNAPMARMLAAATCVVYQSEFCRATADRFLGPATVPSEILYNAVDTTTFTPAARKARNDGLVILVGGTQDLRYRFATALEAFTLIARHRRDARMIVTGRLWWGGGDATAEARRLLAASGVGDRVRLLGPYTQADAPAVYGRADLLLHCKVNDPSPGLVIEALACGLPVVYSSTGGTPELVGPDAGIGVPGESGFERDVPPDPHRLADAILQVAERRGELAEAARQRAVERFDLAPWLARHGEIFERVTARARADA
jgi:glycosyltransferase involved in cell wall biosynthesis